MIPHLNQLLEDFSRRHPQEVLRVRLLRNGAPDEVLVFKGFSSSLVRPTAPDLDVPVIPDDAEILGIDRLRAPYRPQQPEVLAGDRPLSEFLPPDHG
jgi:hypothetical protein